MASTLIMHTTSGCSIIYFCPQLISSFSFFAEAWNQHKLQIHGGPNRSPADLFGFDMMVYGICGDPLLEEEMNNEDVEVYGVDWEGLNDDRVLCSQRK